MPTHTWSKRDIKADLEGFSESDKAIVVLVAIVFDRHKNKGESHDHGAVAQPHVTLKIGMVIAHQGDKGNPYHQNN
jgi:hypothetical protein